jgi:hypothetical protein
VLGPTVGLLMLACDRFRYHPEAIASEVELFADTDPCPEDCEAFLETRLKHARISCRDLSDLLDHEAALPAECARRQVSLLLIEHELHAAREYLCEKGLLAPTPETATSWGELNAGLVQLARIFSPEAQPSADLEPLHRGSRIASLLRDEQHDLEQELAKGPSPTRLFKQMGRQLRETRKPFRLLELWDAHACRLYATPGPQKHPRGSLTEIELTEALAVRRHRQHDFEAGYRMFVEELL